MNSPVPIIVGIAAFGLIMFPLIRNLEDEKDFEKQLQDDYKKRNAEEGDVQI